MAGVLSQSLKRPSGRDAAALLYFLWFGGEPINDTVDDMNFRLNAAVHLRAIGQCKDNRPTKASASIVDRLGVVFRKVAVQRFAPPEGSILKFKGL